MPTLIEYRQEMSQIDLIIFGVLIASLVGVIAIRRVKMPQISPMWMVLGIAYGVRMAQFTQSLWYDETFTSAVAKLNFYDLHRVILADVHPPLMYLPSWLSVRILGFNDIALRLPSLLFGMIGVWMIYKIASSFDVSPVWAGLLVAMDASHIIYSSEARGYALLSVLVLCGVWALVKKRPALFLLVGLAPLTHAVGFVYLVALTPFAIIRRWWAVVAIVWAVASLWLPIMLFVQTSDVSDGFWLGLTGLDTLKYFVMWLGRMPMMIYIICLVVATWVIAISVYRWAYDKIYRYKITPDVIGIFRLMTYPAWVHGAVWFGVPLILFVASIVWHPVFLLRALLPSSQLAVLMIAPHQRLRWMALGLMCISFIYSFDEDYQRVNVREAIAQCGDVDWIYTTSTATTIWAKHYAIAPVVTFWDSDDLNQSLSTDAKWAMGFVYADLLALNGDVCIIHQTNPMMADSQRVLMDDFIKSVAIYTIHPIRHESYFDITIYKFSNGVTTHG